MYQVSTARNLYTFAPCAVLGNFALIVFQLTQQETFRWIVRRHFGRHIFTKLDLFDLGFNAVLPFNLGFARIVQ